MKPMLVRDKEALDKMASIYTGAGLSVVWSDGSSFNAYDDSGALKHIVRVRD